MAGLVAEIYGDALFELAVEEQMTEKWCQEAKLVLEIWQSDAGLERLMVHPAIKKEEKRQLIQTAFQGHLSGQVEGLVELMIKKGRYGQVAPALEHFLKRVRQYKNMGSARVINPFPLEESRKKSIEKRLLETTSYGHLEVEYEVDRSCIGGIVIEVDGRVADGSVRTRLQEMTRQLLAGGRKEGVTSS